MAKTVAGGKTRVVQGESKKRNQESGTVKGNNVKEAKPDFDAIEASASFRELMKKKKAFLVPTTILFLGLYLLFNFIISYTNWLEKSFIGDISWVWVFAFGLFAMTWILVTVYMKRAEKFDEMAVKTLKEFNYDKEENL
ncbi:uncharacterized membrane protein (DUF485 family) [Planomicrobium soli]|uniref:Uncharacterized membrane protein (DUF485 family) n=1 Tax=Planomicrobium soli TaxID=1176648 RepID=A0A2P8H289_9BACL|nr:DUF485 domain-containing protein [Planomicrobium soli]PSL40325.1 uncharacterized membrane protein (DUF485 family) [Planomicrobium soli]